MSDADTGAIAALNRILVSNLKAPLVMVVLGLSCFGFNAAGQSEAAVRKPSGRDSAAILSASQQCNDAAIEKRVQDLLGRMTIEE